MLDPKLVRMEDRNTRPVIMYPGWMVMGAAVFGVLLGAGALYWGNAWPRSSAVLEQIPVVEPAQTPAPDPGEVTSVAPQPTLSSAVADTRGSVVCLKTGDQLQGAGVVYDTAGTVLTNYHVVESALRPLPFTSEREADAITVRFANGRELPARVVITSPEEDIAMLRLLPADSAETFAPAPAGRSDDLVVGQTVFAVGCPLGLSHTVSSGIVSAVERTDILPNPRLPVVQLDASINLGNSGGPLFNLDGQIVGITTARSRKGEGIGFAIPIDRVLALLRAVERGESSRAAEIKLWLTAKHDPADDIAELGYTTGVTVLKVPSGPAKRAGVKPDDIVVEMEGSRFDEFGTDEAARDRILARVIERVRSMIPGEKLELVLVRDGQQILVQIEAEAVSERRQILLDAEDLFGLDFYHDKDPPTVRRLIPGSPVSQRPRAAMLVNAEITHVVGRPVPTVEAFGEVLEDLERRRAAGQYGLTVAVDIRDKKGKRWHVQAFPLSSRGTASGI